MLVHYSRVELLRWLHPTGGGGAGGGHETLGTRNQGPGQRQQVFHTGGRLQHEGIQWLYGRQTCLCCSFKWVTSLEAFSFTLNFFESLGSIHVYLNYLFFLVKKNLGLSIHKKLMNDVWNCFRLEGRGQLHFIQNRRKA